MHCICTNKQLVRRKIVASGRKEVMQKKTLKLSSCSVVAVVCKVNSKSVLVFCSCWAMPES